jgi:hypothetical protein
MKSANTSLATKTTAAMHSYMGGDAKTTNTNTPGDVIKKLREIDIPIDPWTATNSTSQHLQSLRPLARDPRRTLFYVDGYNNDTHDRLNVKKEAVIKQGSNNRQTDSLMKRVTGALQQAKRQSKLESLVMTLTHAVEQQVILAQPPRTKGEKGDQQNLQEYITHHPPNSIQDV